MTTIDQNPLPHRLGPRPLALHLATAMSIWASSRGASTLSSVGSPIWTPPFAEAGRALEDDLAAIAEQLRARTRARTPGKHSLGPEAAETTGAAEAPPEQPGTGKAEDERDVWSRFLSAVDREVAGRLNDLLGAILAYRRHPYRRPDADPEPIWRDGTTRLLAYGDGGRGRPVLAIPSLVNRHYVLDLMPDRSLVRFLAGRGHRPFVVDWDRPGEIERGFTLTDYVAGRLEDALDRVLAETGKRPVLAGYCMGGLLALALAQRRPKDVAGLALLATPWDFSADAPPMVAMLPMMAPSMMAVVDTLGEMPTDMIQSLFYGLDPMLVATKFLRFAALDPAGEAAREFVALEDWLNDGVALAGPVAREALLGWYAESTPARLRWRIAGRTVDPSRVATPSLALIPSRDRIVPPASAEALARALPDARALTTPLGHIGMAVSARARERAWEPLVEWMESLG